MTRDDDPTLLAAEAAAEAERFAKEREDGPEAPAWSTTGQTCGDRALTLTRDARDSYVAEIALIDARGEAFTLDEPNTEEIQLMRELLYFPQMVGLLRRLAGAYPGFPNPRTLVEARELLRDFDKAWP